MLDDPRSLGREDALRVELHAEARQLAMLRRHHEAVLRPRGELELRRQVVALDDQRVVARRFEWHRDALEDAVPLVIHERSLSMHRRRPVHGASRSQADRLVAEAHAEQRGRGRQQIEQFRERPGVTRMPRPGRQHDGVGLHRNELLGRLHVGLHDDGRSPEALDQLDEVVRERVVVVDNEDHAGTSIGATAGSSAAALARVSRSSVSGSESATTPAPAWMLTASPVPPAVRIVMQKSRSPANVRYPTAPAYGPRAVGSCSAISSIARRFGAPVTVPAGNLLASASNGSASARRSPSTVETMCITLEKRSTTMSSVA